MHRNGAILRADRILLSALAIILAMASATVGAALSYRPASASTRIAMVSPTPAPGEGNAVLTDLLSEHRCLSEALYYEARGEGRIGEQAVAEVVFHRLTSGYHGHSLCAV